MGFFGGEDIILFCFLGFVERIIIILGIFGVFSFRERISSWMAREGKGISKILGEENMIRIHLNF